MNIQLTKDSDALISVLYKEYCNKRENGVSKGIAKQFGSSAEIHKSLIPKWNADDVDETCKELSRARLLECFYADNVAQHVWLSDQGIIYMENRFKNGLKDVVGHLETIRNFIPFL